ncbi:MICOS complex subunit Mic27 [Phlebotomus argentipes]|uniref:MICOS complex subunit Mic27 n=1 Tax=Phlebotomus argentipes TaxID=94469 RepID=UPI00289304C3|nr:MICOS complex subunit Mic27 [Phlebotomus argentipes]
MFAAVPVAASPGSPAQSETPKVDKLSSPLICKPSELPLYESLHDQVKKEPCKHPEGSSTSYKSDIESVIRAVRVEACQAVRVVSDNKKQFADAYEHAKDQTIFIRNYLNEEQNTIPRIGAVAIGGLTGFIFGLRGGIFRRLFYGSIGAGAIAAVCYPKEAEKVTQEALTEAKKYSTIAVNFIYGVKPGDEQISLPKIPTSVDEVKESLSGLASSAWKAVFPEK